MAETRSRMGKKWLAIVLLVAVLGVLWPARTVLAEGADFFVGSKIMNVNGSATAMDVAPYIKSGRTFVPVRYLGDALGAVTSWDEANRSITLNKGSQTMILRNGDHKLFVDGLVVVMDVAPEIFNGRTMLPARYVAEGFGYQVSWDADLKQVLVRSGDRLRPEPAQAIDINYQHLEFEWVHEGETMSIQTAITQDMAVAMLEILREQPHPHSTHEEYITTYCLDEDDDLLIAAVVERIKAVADEYGYSTSDTARLIVSFVQGLDYIEDIDSTGSDEYPRYPMETLLEKAGDCEDFAILTATLLRELDFGAALVFFKDHAGVGVEAVEDYPGYYFEVDDVKYFYLETTDRGWVVGDMPEEYRDEPAVVLVVP